ncbi:hypothetical protein P152DRAFT_207084 [Eremomyces bilateralis CBS 781.70]|uniref:Uncharacterized protein n=1 Tax=Eremomyces bilateralis CBS 781.70 TaxID=1392243 RepID=A0A6G1FT51_9PEZI|nr:uncharacterized protein P152DRAFT_207084 [Eremomyces bilateralis CBS 781.70]KAF1808888.1 hypothetical protein P152DRAFT_207084 [Eremomyces bilateralis CBS 781.70]
MELRTPESRRAASAGHISTDRINPRRHPATWRRSFIHPSTHPFIARPRSPLLPSSSTSRSSPNFHPSIHPNHPTLHSSESNHLLRLLPSIAVHDLRYLAGSSLFRHPAYPIPDFRPATRYLSIRCMGARLLSCSLPRGLVCSLACSFGFWESATNRVD